MQKLITVSVDTKQISKNPGSPFTINEVESINELLAMGWQIEEWDFLKEGGTDGEIVLLVILNDNAVYEQDDYFNDDFDQDDEQDEIEGEERMKN